MKECELCSSTENIDMHHTSYEPEETIPLCRSCHQKVHGADEHPLQPEDSAPTTTIEVSEHVKDLLDELKAHPSEPYKNVVQRVLDSDATEETKPLNEEEVRAIIVDEVEKQFREGN